MGKKYKGPSKSTKKRGRGSGATMDDDAVDPHIRIITTPAELVSIDEIQEHPENPRLGDTDAIVGSIDRHGLYGTIIVQRSRGHILKGNHTFRAAKLKGATHVPVQFVDVTDTEALAIMIGDNQISDLAENDDELLQRIFEELDAEDLLGTGFDLSDAGELDRVKVERADEPRDEGRRPISPQLGEKYGYIVILATSAADLDFLRTIFSVEKEQSYQGSRVRPGFVLRFERFLRAWEVHSRDGDSLA